MNGVKPRLTWSLAQPNDHVNYLACKMHVDGKGKREEKENENEKEKEKKKAI